MNQKYYLLPCVMSVALFILGCSTERVITQPEVVEIVRLERVPVPAELLVMHQPTTVPETLTYGESLQLWAEDRSIIQTLLGQLVAIESLNEPEPE